MEITQEKRLDLTDIREEAEAYLNSNTQKIIKIFDENTPNGRLYIDKENLIAENQRLKAQLDKEIHINRKMKSALEKYADNINWGVDRFSNKYKKWLKSENGYKLAKQVLKEIDNKE